MAAPSDAAAPKAGTPAFRQTRASAPSAVLFEVPHAGLELPSPLSSRIDVTPDELRRDADIYVDDLCAGVTDHGADLLSANWSRYVVDLNRSAGDVDRSTVSDHPSPLGSPGRGVVWRTTTRGRVCVHPELDYRAFAERIQRYHQPYHAALRAWLTAARAEHGYGIVLAAHSMPSQGRPGDPARADVVPGSLGRTSCAPAILDAIDRVCLSAELRVQHDDPYRGGYTTAHYGRPAEGWHVVQLELNRALYVDEETFERRPSGYEAVREMLHQLAEELAALRLSWLRRFL